MESIKLREGEEFIKLGQALKVSGLAESGVEAKQIIQEGLVSVNQEVDTRRGRKLYACLLYTSYIPRYIGNNRVQGEQYGHLN